MVNPMSDYPSSLSRRFALPIVLILLALAGAPPSFGHALSVWAEVLEDGETVRVEVHTSDGRPVARATVRVLGADSELRASGETDTEGRFEMRRELAEDLTIQASAGGHHESEVLLAADGSLREP